MARLRSRKRKFQGNQHAVSKLAKLSQNSPQNASPSTPSSHVPEHDESSTIKASQSASARKIGEIGDTSVATVNEDKVSGYRFIDIAILCSIFQMLPCKNCFKCQLTLTDDSSKRMGCASCLFLTCNSCGWTETFYTSEKNGHCFEINRRMVYAMRSIGCGQSSMSRFCSTMNMPPPVGSKPFREHTKAILRAAKDVAEQAIKDAAQEIYECKTEGSGDIVETAISCDGTWQRRGFSSLHGCVTVISMENGKILDVEPLSKVCKACKKHEDDADTTEHELWKAKHQPKCKANYTGSSPAMEPEGARRIFNRSVSSHNLQYTEFYGDGDSKSFSAVEDIYEKDYGVVVQKKECVGHVQKRLGTALRKLKKETKGLGGKGKLTDSMIDKLQNYYGIAIRSNSGNLESMKKDILASLWHCSSTESHPFHSAYCPPGEDSWCGYMQDKAKKTSTYKHGKGLPIPVSTALKPTYAKLSDDNLLRKCLDGKTQNQNESFNGMIWTRIPKTVFVGTNAFQLGVYDAVAHFNIGAKATIEVFKALGINPGAFCVAGVREADRLRVTKSIYKAEEKNKVRRKVIRGRNKRKGDKNEEREGKTYATGSF